MSDSSFPALERNSSINSLLAWVKSHERKILLAAVILQIGFLLSMIFIRATPLLTGETILVRVQPVDPRDLFRGDYVILSYEFSRVPPGGIIGLSDANSSRQRDWPGHTVYVALLPDTDGRHYRADKFSLQPPGTGKYLRGTININGAIDFGIESYYVQEGQGKMYEEAIGQRKLSAEIAVTSTGQAALRRLVIE